MYQTSQSQGSGYSRLESMAHSYTPSSGQIAYAASAPVQSYSTPMFVPKAAVQEYSTEMPKAYHKDESKYHFFNPKQEYAFIPDNFLKPGKGSKFVGKADEVKEFVEKTFEKTFNIPFPDDIKISILDEKQFRKLAPSPATIGLSINRREHGLLSEIFVKNDYLGRIMLTIGHELGHVLTSTLDNAQNEEAKAYAFSLMWMKVIKENNIAGLGEAIILENPAENGLHDVAFGFVHKLIQKGEEIKEVYSKLINRLISVAS